IDPKRVNGRFEVHINGGRVPTGLEAVSWAKKVELLGAGEIVLTSMDCDGTKDGYDLEITKAVSEAVTIPVVASGGGGRPAELDVNKFFRALVKLEGSDLHLKVGKPPCVRVRNELKPLNHPSVERREMAEYLVPMMNDRNRRIFDDEGGADFSHVCEVDGVKWRFRVNLLQQNGCMGLVARRISNKIPDFKGLYLPPAIEQLCFYDQGMVLLAGVTGSGKSTTIASMLDFINHRERVHILTLEDPIEFIFTEDKALINQREIGFDVKDFKIGMKHAVREDPDIMLVGEMRDEETFMTAIHAAETGH